MLVRNKIKVDSVLGSFNKAIDRVDNKLKRMKTQQIMQLLNLVKLLTSIPMIML